MKLVISRGQQSEMDDEVLRKCVAFNMLITDMIKEELLRNTPFNANFSEVTNLFPGAVAQEARHLKLEKLFRCFKREWPKPAVDYTKLEKKFFTEFFGFYLEEQTK